jgi:hypothetical protein
MAGSAAGSAVGLSTLQCALAMLYRLVLQPIPPPPPNAEVIDPPEGHQGPLIKGEKGDIDVVCGHCYRLVGENLEFGQFRGLVVQCPNCLEYNALDIPPLQGSNIRNPDTPPAYSVSATVRQPRVKPGGRINIDYFCFGTGPIWSHKFIVHVPPMLVEGEIEARTFSYVTAPDGATGPRDRPTVVRGPGGSPFTIHFLRQYFTPGVPLRAGALPILFSEGTVTCPDRKYAPIEVEFAVTKGAPPGDHFIVARLVYEGSGAAAIAEAQAAVHINTYGERYHNPLIGLLGVVVAVATLVYEAVPSDWKVWTIVGATWVILGIVYLLFRH